MIPELEYEEPNLFARATNVELYSNYQPRDIMVRIKTLGVKGRAVVDEPSSSSISGSDGEQSSLSSSSSRMSRTSSASSALILVIVPT